MGSVVCWVCPSCNVYVSVDFKTCPRCGHPSPSIPPPTLPPEPASKRPMAWWGQAVSVPTAIMGIVAFFLPWFQISCGPERLQFSGYEFATGKWEDKMRPEASQDFWDRVNNGLERGHPKRGTAHGGAPATKRPTNQVQGQVPEASAMPLLWVVPIACGCLLLLALFGVPKVPTVLASLAGSGYMAYFAVEFSSSASDPRNTGGILEYSWLLGFWMAWVGLVAPAIVALARPNRR
jgi:hypothetical protein